MAERPDDIPSDEPVPSELPNGSDDTDAPIEHRREASARFVVEGGTSSTAELRDAMDPANQSLAEALRLSYRVLQAGILVLIVIFLLSGFQSVREGATGVKTIFGKIVGTGGDEQLAPGLQPFWPYPVGEFVVLDQKMSIALEHEFEPRERENERTRNAAVDASEASRDILAGRDGFVLTSDGDIAHVAVTATFNVTDAVQFLRQTSPEKAKQLLRSTLMRATVMAAGKFTLHDFLELRDAPAQEIHDTAQAFLKDLNLGVQVGEVSFIERAPPRFVEQRYREVQFNAANATAVIERARQEVAATLTGVIGSRDQREPREGVGQEEEAYEQVWKLINEYDIALLANDPTKADAFANQISERLQRPDVTGEVASILLRAKARASTQSAALARDVTRIRGLTPAFEQDPQQITRQLWLEALRSVMSNPELEVFSVPKNVGDFLITQKSSQQIMQTRRDQQLKRLKQAAESVNPFENFQFRGSQIAPGESFSRLEKDASKGKGRDDIKGETRGVHPSD